MYYILFLFIPMSIATDIFNVLYSIPIYSYVIGIKYNSIPIYSYVIGIKYNTLKISVAIDGALKSQHQEDIGTFPKVPLRTKIFACILTTALSPGRCELREPCRANSWNSWKRYFLYSPCRGYIARRNHSLKESSQVGRSFPWANEGRDLLRNEDQ
jgi:hypothetical protein